MKYVQMIMSPEKVERTILDALLKKKPFSLIRIYDGELRMLGYKIFVSKEQMPNWFRYTGVNVPNEEVRSALLKAFREADMVGLPTRDEFVFRPLAERVIDYFKIQPKKICHGAIHSMLYKNGGLARLVKGRRIILLGCTIHKVAPNFAKMGAKISMVETVNSFSDIPRVMAKISASPPFDMALVSAGIPAKILCTKIRKNFGKVALDIGHVPELIQYPNKKYLDVINQWLVEHPASKK
jgi:hypothetical protein